MNSIFNAEVLVFPVVYFNYFAYKEECMMAFFCGACLQLLFIPNHLNCDIVVTIVRGALLYSKQL